jgi:hypothetical protein
MKEPWEWQEEDLLRLIADARQEDISLDYKRSDSLAKDEAKKTEISKDVSAFANSAGGTIVYGVEEVDQLPVRIDAGCDPKVVSREWLEQVINSRIQRKIDGLRIKQIELHKTSPGRVAYVVTVPESLRAPHQASDKKFYKRYNFQSVAMEEYEIRDVSRRSESPDLSVVFVINSQNTKREARGEYGDEVRVLVLRMHVLARNGSPVPAEYARFELLIDERLRPALRELGHGANEPMTFGGREASAKRYHFNWGIPNRLPLWEGLDQNLTTERLTISLEENAGEHFLHWTAQSPRMTRREGSYIVEWRDGKLHFGPA